MNNRKNILSLLIFSIFIISQFSCDFSQAFDYSQGIKSRISEDDENFTSINSEEKIKTINPISFFVVPGDDSPQDMTIGGGYFWVTGASTDSILKIDMDGNLIETIETDWGYNFYGWYPHGIAYDTNENRIYTTGGKEYSKYLYRFYINDYANYDFLLLESFGNTGLEIDGDNLYVSCPAYYSSNKCFKYNKNSAEVLLMYGYPGSTLTVSDEYIFIVYDQYSDYTENIIVLNKTSSAKVDEYEFNGTRFISGIKWFDGYLYVLGRDTKKIFKCTVD